MTKELRVCFLAGTLGRGGAERQLIYLLQAAQSEGIQTRVVCLTKGESFETEIRRLGVPIEWIGASPSRPVRLARLIRSLRSQPVNILQCIHFYTNLYAAAAGRILGINEIGAIRSDLFNEIKANGWLGHWQLRSPRHLIVNSRLARERAINLGVNPDRIDYLPNVVSFEKAAGRRDASCKCINISFVGRLSSEKGPDRFLRAASRLIREHPTRRLLFKVAGDGPLFGEMKSLAAKLELGPDQLELLGQQTDMESFYARTDILVMCSLLEGTPNVLLEAMIRGIPVVAPGVGGIPALLADGRGLVVEPNNEEDLVKGISRLISNDGLKRELGERSRAYVEERHSQESVSQQLVTIYRRLLSK